MRLVDGDDVVGELLAQLVDARLGHQVIGQGTAARGELVGRVGVDVGVDAADPGPAVHVPTDRNVDVDRCPVRSRTGVRRLELDVVGAPGDIVTDRDGDVRAWSHRSRRRRRRRGGEAGQTAHRRQHGCGEYAATEDWFHVISLVTRIAAYRQCRQ
jgi:hypothetical protein